ncbi:MAG: hypothetical protein HFG87_08145 [Dorea sp.]|jgi:hypothetical protein|nr:hypothetical protein [Dorea sp.]MCI9227806.1 hypothetical protein [Dorea sp.]
MYNYKIVEQVIRKPKPLTGVLRTVMLIFAVILLLLGIILSQGFMLPGFLLVALYYFYNTYSQKEYEYILEDNHLTIDVIFGKKHRRSAHYLDMDALEVLAPNWHDSVARYRRNGGSIRLPKYDYTSYEEDTPFYTMIITENKEKIKLLLDLNDNMLQMIKRRYPDRVFL